MPVIEDQITTPPAGIMPVMQVIEAQRASILVPHDHLHNNHVSEAGTLARDGSGRVDLRAHRLHQPCLPRQLRLTGLRSA